MTNLGASLFRGVIKVGLTANRRNVMPRAIAALLVGVLPALPTVANAQGTVGFTIPTSLFVNIYWDANWDVNNPSMTMNQIDNFVSALTNSTYFSGLGEYGVTTVAFNPLSFKADPSCLATAPPFIDLAAMEAFVACEASRPGMPGGTIPGGLGVIYNVFLPSSTIQGDVALTSCVNYLGYHFSATDVSLIPPGVRILPFTANFANSSCSGSFSALMTNLTHEMVEAVTDPFVSISVLLSGGDTEIADLCGSGTTPFLVPIGGGATQNYFSNALGRCVSGYASAATPSFTATVSKSGPQTAIAISGTGLGTLPPVRVFKANSSSPVTLPATNELPYLAVTDFTQGWVAGDLLNPADRMFLSYASWSPGAITINGFGSTVSPPAPGDALGIIACNPGSGACSTTFRIGVSSQPIVTDVSPFFGPADGGTLVTITGTGFGTAPVVNFTFEPSQLNVPVTIVGQPSDKKIQVITKPFKPDGVLVEITNNGVQAGQFGLFYYCAPSVSGVSPKTGPLSGGVHVTISGSCFTGATSVRFGTAGLVAAPAMQVISDSQIDVIAPNYAHPSLFGCGLVDVVVNSPSQNNSFISSAVANGDRFQYTGTACVPIPQVAPNEWYPTLCELYPQDCHGTIQSNPIIISPPSPLTFEDLSGYEWAAPEITLIAGQGVLPGLAPNRFGPAGLVSREEFALALTRMLVFPALKTELVFSDVGPNQSGKSALARVQPYMTTYGNSNGTLSFHAPVPVEREEATATISTILARSGKVRLLKNTEEIDRILGEIPDGIAIPPKFRPYVATAIRYKLIRLDSGGAFRPTSFVTRGELAPALALLEKYYDHVQMVKHKAKRAEAKNVPHRHL